MNEAADSCGEREIEAAILDLVAQRGAEKTVCPSEVARHLGGANPDDWRLLMQPVRRVAVRLAKQGRIAILRKGAPVTDLDGFKGIIGLGCREADRDVSLGPLSSLTRDAGAKGRAPSPECRRSPISTISLLEGRPT